MAGIIFQTSFDHYSTTTHRFNSTAGVGPPTTTTVGAGRNSTAGLRFTNSTSALVARTLPTTPADIWFAFANPAATLPTGTNSRVIAELRNAGTRSIHVRVRADGTLGIYSGGTTGILNGTLLGNLSGFAMLTNTFYHFELYIRFSATVGLVQFRVNEVEKLNLTGQNTGATNASEIILAHAGDAVTVNSDFDDIVVRDDDWNGDVQVRAFLPTGIGATNQWTATGAATTREAVDEAAPNSDTDYIEEATVNELSLFTYDSIPATSEIRAVVPLPFAKKTDAGTAKIKSTVRLSATNYDGAEQAPSNGSYEYHPDILMVSPDTAVAFTAAEWNAPIEIGPKRTA